MDTAGSTTTTSTLGYDVASELTSLLVKQGSTTTKSLTLSYNRDGDRTGQTDSVGGGTVGCGYDQADRLTGYSKGGSQWTYAYDGDGLRQSKAITSTVEPYTYDLAEGLPLIVQDGATRYLTGPGGLPVEQVDGAGTVLYYRQDQLGSTRALVDGSGAVKGQYSYDAYGNTVAISGTATTPFGYAGQYTDAESGLEYLRARYYDPATEQFLTRDPLALMTDQPYAYADDNPVNADDPSGLWCWSCIPGAIWHFVSHIYRAPSCRGPNQAAVLTNVRARAAADNVSNAIKNNLKPDDLEGAWKDFHAQPVLDPRFNPRYYPGKYWKHGEEVVNAIEALRKAVATYQELLADTRVSAQDRQVIAKLLGKTYQTLEYVEKVITRSGWYPIEHLLDPLEFRALPEPEAPTVPVEIPEIPLLP